MTTALEEAKATASRLLQLIQTLEAAAPVQAPATTTLALPALGIELQPGEHYAGVIVGGDGLPLHHLILLPGQAEDVTWDAAKTWATSVGGELPTRREQSLLFANLHGKFERAWYWSAEAHETDGFFAWYQSFYDGRQYYSPKSFEGRARAVRRLTA